MKEINYLMLNFILLFFISFSLEASNIDSIFSNKTSLKNPKELRDPFRAPMFKETQVNEEIKYKKDNNNFSNIKELGVVNLSEIVITGVLIGENRRAILKLKNGTDYYTIEEGMVIGKNNAEVKAIIPGGIIVVEKMENIYGEQEFLETVIPISR